METGPNGRVRELKLEGNGLTGQIPAELGLLSELTVLSLWGNQLDGDIPPELGDLLMLQALFLDANQLTGEIPRQLGNLSALNELWLSDNRIVGKIPAALGDLKSLSRLFLNGNQLTGPIPPELSQPSNLVVLNLSHNQLDGKIPTELGSLSSLEELDLAVNPLVGELPTDFGNLTKLKLLGLNDTALEGCLPDGLTDVADIRLGDIKVEYCRGRSALVALYDATDGANWVNNENWLSAEPIREWFGVIADERDRVLGLNLGSNGLRGELPTELANLKKLTRLVLFGNDIRGELPAELEVLSELKRFFVGGNRLSGCVPDGLKDVPQNDLVTIGTPFCSADSSQTPATEQPIVLSVFSTSPTQINLSWSYDFEDVTTQIVLRDGGQVGVPPTDQRTYIESDLKPNTLHKYRLMVQLADGSLESAEAIVATLAASPQLAEPANISQFGFALPIIDELNPPNTAYRLTLIGAEEEYPSDWSNSRCRVFDGLTSGHGYRFELLVRNQDGIETYPAVTGKHGSDQYGDDVLNTQVLVGNDDPWARSAIDAAAQIYGFTERALNWMLADVRVVGARNKPSVGGITEFIEIGYPVGAKILMHEVMHGFWSHWDGFGSDCGESNSYTFRRDVAQFMIEFRNLEESNQPNPWEEWRPFYNYLVGKAHDGTNSEGKDFWEILERRRYGELWGALYHLVDTEFPSNVAGNLSLIPPPLRPYFNGVIADKNATTWREELDWYSRFHPEDKRLWDNSYTYWEFLYYSPRYAAPANAARAGIDQQRRQLLREADRQQLVDFINTLEDIACEVNCKNLWDSEYAYWTYELEDHMLRHQLYFDELDPEIGIELEDANLEAVGRGLEIVVSELYCGDVTAESARDSLDAVQGITDLQKVALHQIIDQVADPSQGILAARAKCHSSQQ